MVVRCHARRVYMEAERAFNERSKALLTNTPNTRKRWSTVKTAIYGLPSCSFPPLFDRGGRLVWSADEKASLLSAHFGAKIV